MTPFVRPRRGRLLAGVCQGVADRFACSVVPVRVLMFASTIFFGVSIWFYLFLWILIPDES